MPAPENKYEFRLCIRCVTVFVLNQAEVRVQIMYFLKVIKVMGHDKKLQNSCQWDEDVENQALLQDFSPSQASFWTFLSKQ